MSNQGIVHPRLIPLLRTMLEKALPETCDIQRVTRTSDGQGGYTETWVTAAGSTDVPYRRSPMGAPTEQRLADRLAGKAGWILTFAYDADVLAADRVVDGTSQYEVIGLLSGGAYATDKRVAAVEVV